MQRYSIDPSHSGVHFSVRHMVISKVKGTFDAWSGTIDYDPDQVERSSVAVEIDAASINTREAKRDDHLRSADFFDVATYPKLTFRSTTVERTGDGLAVTGDLTLHGVTRAVTLAIEELGAGKDPWGGSRIGWSARATLNRKDFDLRWNVALEAGGVLVGEKIELELEVEAVAAAAAAA